MGGGRKEGRERTQAGSQICRLPSLAEGTKEEVCGSVIEKCTVINLDVNQAYGQNRKSSLNMFGYIRC